LTKWKTVSGVVVPSIEQYVADASATGQAVHIGTDSLQCGRETQFVTVVAVLTPHHGGRAAYSQVTVPRMASMRERLFKEVWHSVELGLVLTDKVKGELTIHVDANPNERYMSSRYVQELVGLVLGQGFKVLIKPESWAATHVADHYVRVLTTSPHRRTEQSRHGRQVAS
jgi:predicted RNase H-related nuclease YkuK (DUF458 family)